MKSFEELFNIVSPHTIVSSDRLKILYDLAVKGLETPGTYYECGVYKGGTALLLAHVLDKQRTLRLFDTFTGMPKVNEQYDLHKQGDFKDTTLKSVTELFEYYGFKFPDVVFYEGKIPRTFPKLFEEQIAFAHIDVDIYQSVLDCCEYITPRLSEKGIIVFDDYGFSSCPGAKKAVDEYYENRWEYLYVLYTKQAVISKKKIPELNALLA
jgi:O-methyltransferase